MSARVLGYGTTAATTIITITTTVVIADINIHMHRESDLDPPMHTACSRPRDARTGSTDCLNCRCGGGDGQLSKFLAQDTVAPQAIANPEPYHQES